MFYYRWDIGEYKKRTSHLSLVEDAIYRRLIDTYLMEELPLTPDLDRLRRNHALRSDDEFHALDAVLKDFFVLNDQGYSNEFCNGIISEYQSKSRASVKAANARWAKQPKELRTHCQDNAEAIPIRNKELKIMNEREATPKSPRTKVSENFEPNESGKAYARSKNVDIAEQTERFRNFHLSKGSVMSDWDACWRTWVDRAVDLGMVEEEKIWARGL